MSNAKLLHPKKTSNKLQIFVMANNTLHCFSQKEEGYATNEFQESFYFLQHSGILLRVYPKDTWKLFSKQPGYSSTYASSLYM
ncbi:hypothetical protein GDO81_013439 [Engystomops pustulosus]|uniref:Uncharacterized protein n=1 Tax=Engystomops pustulosus TaxID=76066 RepID=A0AAV7B0G1_ENGPU|nr:hypothetical protein GDO81_013439 [Engystomops pustulosus]